MVMVIKEQQIDLLEVGVQPTAVEDGLEGNDIEQEQEHEEEQGWGQEQEQEQAQAQGWRQEQEQEHVLVEAEEQPTVVEDGLEENDIVPLYYNYY
jgi:hypothetical protein